MDNLTQEKETNNTEDDYVRIPMFEEFEDGDEFSPIINDLFGVMS